MNNDMVPPNHCKTYFPLNLRWDIPRILCSNGNTSASTPDLIICGNVVKLWFAVGFPFNQTSEKFFNSSKSFLLLTHTNSPSASLTMVILIDPKEWLSELFILKSHETHVKKPHKIAFFPHHFPHVNSCLWFISPSNMCNGLWAYCYII